MSRKAVVLLVLSLFVFCGGGQAFAAQDAPSFGHTWKSFSDKEKESFLIGIATAVQLTCEPLSLVKGKDEKPTVDQNRYADCFNEFAGIDRFKVISGMNDFYNDSKNTFIPLSGAYRLTIMKLRGAKIDDLLVQARKYGDAVKKKLEQEQAKPAN